MKGSQAAGVHDKQAVLGSTQELVENLLDAALLSNHGQDPAIMKVVLGTCEVARKIGFGVGGLGLQFERHCIETIDSKRCAHILLSMLL